MTERESSAERAAKPSGPPDEGPIEPGGEPGGSASMPAASRPPSVVPGGEPGGSASVPAASRAPSVVPAPAVVAPPPPPSIPVAALLAEPASREDFAAAARAIEAKPEPPHEPSLRDLASAARIDLEAREVASAKELPVAVRDSARPRAAGTASVHALASDARPLAAYEMLARSARLGDLVALTAPVVGDAARARATSWSFTAKVSTTAEELKLPREEADTRFGNALDVLATGGEGAAEHALASALWAHAIAESRRTRGDDRDTLAGDILWLSTHTSFDATPLLDRALGEDAAELWDAIAGRVRRVERGGLGGGALGRGEAIVGCAALAASGADRAKALCAELAREVKDPVLLRVLATGDHAMPEEVRLEGELLAPPRGIVATTLLAVTGILLAVHVLRLLARVALAYRRPAEVSLSDHGVRVKTRTELLGRTLREREHVILRTGLVRVVREVRFPRLAFYAGLLALVIGSYIGVRAFVDGVRAASPSLLVVGLLVVGLGIGADFVLGTLLPGSRGRCRVAFVPRTGATVCVGDVDVRRADDALTRSLKR